ncbi:hypothetical protein ACFLX5_04930 [Chloroflexota bacterium]
MANQIYWEDMQEGSEVTPLPKIATTQMLMKWGGHSNDFNPAHYEDSFAKAQGMDRAYVHGQLKRAWLCQLMTDWIGEEGWLKNLGCQFRAIDYPRFMKTMFEPHDGETWMCKGKVVKKYKTDDGEHCVDCEIWVENGKGEVTTPGTATAVLPLKK